MRPGRTSSPRIRVALALLGLLLAHRPAASDPPTVFPLPAPPRESHTRAYVAFAAGAALTVGSFALQRSADRAYDRYLVSTDPEGITSAYDEAHRLDRWSAVTLLAGTGGLALGVYWRFIHRPSAERGATLEVEPVLTPHQSGLALALRWQ
jgi:hypothetical protein